MSRLLTNLVDLTAREPMIALPQDEQNVLTRFRLRCVASLRRRYPNGMPDETHLKAAIWDYALGWADEMQENRWWPGQQDLLVEFRRAIEPISQPEWHPGEEWRWW